MVARHCVVAMYIVSGASFHVPQLELKHRTGHKQCVPLSYLQYVMKIMFLEHAVPVFQMLSVQDCDEPL